MRGYNEAPERFKILFKRYAVYPHLPVLKKDWFWILGELDKMYMLHENAWKLSDKWRKQRDKAETDVEMLIAILKEVHENLLECNAHHIESDLGKKVEAIVHAGSDRSRRNALR